MLVKLNKEKRYEKLKKLFKYSKNKKDKCIKLGIYRTVLPQNAKELFLYAEEFVNCMLGYEESIINDFTTIYIFYKDNVTKFAVEVLENNLVQASTKYNGALDIEDEIALNAWIKQFKINDSRYSIK